MAKKSEVKFDITQLKVIQTALNKMTDGHYTVQVGIFGDKDARPKSKNMGMTNSEIGLIHEMGSVSRQIPRRSFLWDTFNNHGKELIPVLKNDVETLFKNGKIDAYLKRVGEAAKNLVLDAFQTSGWGSWAPNKPSTIAAKGSDKPLIDGGELWQSISYRTVKA